MTNNTRNAGRKKLPADRKKIAGSIYLIPAEIEFLEAKYGSLTLAIRSLIINQI